MVFMEYVRLLLIGGMFLLGAYTLARLVARAFYEEKLRYQLNVAAILDESKKGEPADG